MAFFNKSKYTPLGLNIFKKKDDIVINKAVESHEAQSLEDIKTEEPVVSVKCRGCGKEITKAEAGKYKICPKCGKYFRLGARERVYITADKGSFVEFDANMTAANPLNFPDYEEKIADTQNKTGIKDAVVTGKCK